MDIRKFKEKYPKYKKIYENFIEAWNIASERERSRVGCEDVTLNKLDPEENYPLRKFFLIVDKTKQDVHS